MKTEDALSAGIHPRTLYEIHRSDILEQLTRGLYRLVDPPPLGNPDLVDVPQNLAEVVAAIAAFLKPIAEELVAGRVLKATWKAPGPWLK